MNNRWIHPMLISCVLMGGWALPLYAGAQKKSSAESPVAEKAQSAQGATNDMVLVPGTDPNHLFHLGREKEGIPVKAFRMNRTGVTTDEFSSYYNGLSKEAQLAALPKGDNNYCNYDLAKKQPKAGKGNHPMNCVTFSQAEAYCKAQGKRLPTEVEREYAARGVQGSKYPWGNDLPSDQNACFSGGKTPREGTCPVASYGKTLLGQKNEAGIADLSGNLWEWTDSAYTDKKDEEVKHPKHLSCKEGNRCVLRGGSWNNSIPESLRSSLRDFVNPSNWYYLVGFRCVRTE